MINERMQKRREKLLKEEEALMAELRAMEDLVQEGRDRIRTAESGASSFAAHSGDLL